MGRSTVAAARGSLSIVLLAFAVLAAGGIALAQSADPADQPAGDSPGDTGDAPTDGADDTASGDTTAADGDDGAPTGAPATATGDDVPVNLRLRRLEQRVQSLKERAWRAKARVGMLREAVLGGGVGARASVVHENDMGSSFRLLRLTYGLDGNQIFTRADSTGALHKEKNFDVLTGPIAPGSHTISVVAEYRGHGYGVFRYLNKYRFTTRASHTFTLEEGDSIDIRVVAYEKGGVTTPLEQRPAIDFRANITKAKRGE